MTLTTNIFSARYPDGLKFFPIIIKSASPRPGGLSPSAYMRFLKTFDSFAFKMYYQTKTTVVDGKNDTGQSINQLSRNL